MAHFTTSDGLKIYFEDDGGAGLPVLCLAGLTRTCRDFDYVAPHLSNVRMIRMDYRGRGESDWDDDWLNYSLPVECRDVLELLQHLGLERVAVLGTSRGGLNAMGLSAAAPDTLLGVALNDIGPDIDATGLDFIMGYLGRNPASKSHEEIAAASAKIMTGFEGVPAERWLNEARIHYTQTPDGMQITYDSNLRKAIEATSHQATPDLWPYFEAIPDRPLALIWGVNSDLLKEETVARMSAQRPDMMVARVPGRGHIPFLDEAESVAVLRAWVEAMQ